jgi:hypothetical protein
LVFIRLVLYAEVNTKKERKRKNINGGKKNKNEQKKNNNKNRIGEKEAFGKR